MNSHSIRRGSMLASATIAGIVALSGCSTDETAASTSVSQVDEETTTITTTTTVKDDNESADTPNPDIDGNDTDGSSSALAQEEVLKEAVADLNSMEGGSGSGWTIMDNTNWDITSELTFASAVQDEITHSTTSGAMLLFHKGEYADTVDGPRVVNSVEGDGKIAAVNFFDISKMIEDGDAFTFRGQHDAPVTYSWGGSEVAQEGETSEVEGN